MRVSECGTYISWLSHVYTLKIYDVDTKRIAHAYDVITTVKQHLSLNHQVALKIGPVRWEHVQEGQKSTKIAVCVDTYSLIIVYDLRDESVEPMIIQQDHNDGIEDFFWIPAIEPLNETQEQGAYVNSKQLLVYTKKYLQARLYSLDCTHIVWKLSKPVSRQPLINPTDKRLWSLVFESRSPKANDLNPIVYHFFNDGTVSNLLYRFKLPNILLSEQFELNWSQSGKWLLYFNCVDNLFGFELQVFNALGVNQKQEFNSPDIIPMGDPIINVDWLTNGIEGEASPLELGSLKYFFTTITVDDITDYIVVASMNDSSDLELVTVSVKDFRVINKNKIDDFSKLIFWRQAFDGDNIYYSKSRSDVKSHSLDIKRLLVINQGATNLVVVQFEDSILINEFSVHDDSVNKSITYKPIQFISTDKITNVHVLDGASLLVTTSTHIFSYNLDQISLLYQNFPSISHSELKLQKLVILPDFESENWVVKQVNQKLSASPVKNIPYKITNLGSSPLKTEISRLISKPRTLATSFTEENTDTFMNKRIRRN